MPSPISINVNPTERRTNPETTKTQSAKDKIQESTRDTVSSAREGYEKVSEAGSEAAEKAMGAASHLKQRGSAGLRSAQGTTMEYGRAAQERAQETLQQASDMSQSARTWIGEKSQSLSQTLFSVISGAASLAKETTHQSLDLARGTLNKSFGIASNVTVTSAALSYRVFSAVAPSFVIKRADDAIEFGKQALHQPLLDTVKQTAALPREMVVYLGTRATMLREQAGQMATNARASLMDPVGTAKGFVPPPLMAVAVWGIDKTTLIAHQTRQTLGEYAFVDRLGQMTKNLRDRARALYDFVLIKWKVKTS